jgi:hypothetical protein
MGKPSEKKVKADKLRFFLDKKAQSYMENQDYLETEQNIIHSLEEYFDFLEGIEPACINPQENQIIDKQFIL